MSVQVKTFQGAAAEPYLSDLARLRIAVFREYPYLYKGSLEYEEQYLASFLGVERAVIVVAFAAGRVVGVSTGMPLEEETADIRQPWLDRGASTAPFFYFSESVLLPAYRGRGIGVQFFAGREAWAQHLGFPQAVFCAVVRPEDHPLRPADYVPLDRFWKNRGYEKKAGYECRISWKEVGEEAETPKVLQFWEKRLLSDH